MRLRLSAAATVKQRATCLQSDFTEKNPAAGCAMPRGKIQRRPPRATASAGGERLYRLTRRGARIGARRPTRSGRERGRGARRQGTRAGAADDGELRARRHGGPLALELLDSERIRT